MELYFMVLIFISKKGISCAKPGTDDFGISYIKSCTINEEQIAVVKYHLVFKIVYISLHV